MPCSTWGSAGASEPISLCISSVACHIWVLNIPNMCLHSRSVRSFGLCFKAVSGRVSRKAGREGVGVGVGGWTLALKWVFCGVLFVESELSWALLLCGCHGEKHRLLCNKIIQEKTFPRIFQSQETDGKLQNSWGAVVHRPPLSALHFRALVFILWKLQGLSPLT